MQVTTELIRKFLDNRCTAEEASAVAAYLHDHPELLPQHLQASWNEAGVPRHIPEYYREDMLAQIKRSAFGSRPAIRQSLRVWVGVAASLIIMISIWMLQSKKHPGAEARLAAKAETAWVVLDNTSAGPRTLKLEDSSVVTLYAGATLKHGLHFSAGRRDLYLQGEARFEVAADKARPFAVHSGRLTTTALGTVFQVKENESGASVRLYSGKVMVTANGQPAKGEKAIYLEPGQEFTYSALTESLAVKEFIKKKKEKAVGEPSPGNRNNALLVFDNTPLAEVMEQLTEVYHQPITYNEEQLKDMYFSGTVLKGDALSLILKIIGQMNKLEITQNAEGFRVAASP